MTADEHERLARFALWLLPGVSGRMIDALRAGFGSAAEAVAAPRGPLAAVLGEKVAARLPADPLAHAAALLDQLHGGGGKLLLRGDPGFPDLGALADPPEALCLRGVLPTEAAVAIVGSRACDAAGRDDARRLAAAAARAGRVIVSGGALGIDAAAHRGALDAGGPTVVVLGSGVLRPGPPSHRRLFAQVLSSKGALLSELPPQESSWPGAFPRRNRLVAALSRAVVVVRADRGSGSLHTAEAARKQGVPVLAHARGGPGCEELIAGGALPFADVGAALALLGVAAPAEDAILAAVGARASAASVAARTGLPLPEVARALSRLCNQGRLRPGGAGEFVRA